MSNTTSVRITIDLNVIPNGMSEEDLRVQFAAFAFDGYNEGRLTGNTPAELGGDENEFRVGVEVGQPARLATSDDGALSELQSTIQKLALQVEKMRGMFDPSDGAVAGALQDAEGAFAILGSLRGRLAREARANAGPAAGNEQILAGVRSTLLKLSGHVEKGGLLHPGDADIARVLEDVSDADANLGCLLGRLAPEARGKLAAAAPPHVILKIVDGGVAQALATAPVQVTLLDANVPDQWEADIVLVEGEGHEQLVPAIEVDPYQAGVIERQMEHAAEIVKALNAIMDDDVQSELDELVCDTATGHAAAEHGSLTEEAIAGAEAKAAAINNEGVAAQVCYVAGHGHLETLRELAGLTKPKPASTPGMG